MQQIERAQITRASYQSDQATGDQMDVLDRAIDHMLRKHALYPAFVLNPD